MVVCRQGLSVAAALGLLVGCGFGDRPDSHTVRSVPNSIQVAAPKLVYTDGAVNIRSGPSGTSEIIRQAPPNEALEYQRLEAGWYELVVAEGEPSQRVHSSDVVRATEYKAKQSVQLELSDLSWMRERKYVLVSGVVTNVSDSSLEGIVVDVVFVNAEGGFVTSEFAMVDSNPVDPGQASTFSVMETHDPEISSASVSFRTLGGNAVIARYIQP